MIVGFSRHSSGAGRGPVNYLTKAVNGDGATREPLPVVVRGDPELVRALIDIVPFERTYVSGVLSFAPGERITPAMEQRIMDGFEQAAFAGLDAGRYSILWVRHTHAGHHELHFVTPRMELVSGKSLNIHPPGPVSQKLFDTFRSQINSEYGLADPDDPARAQDVSLPNHLARIRAQAVRQGKALQETLREAITEHVRREVDAGRITDRDGVAAFLEAQGYTLPRKKGADYLTVLDPATGERLRLKGSLYRQAGWNAREEQVSQVRYGVADPERAAMHTALLAPMVEARAAFHRSRYGEPEPDGTPRREREAGRGPEPLREYVARHLGADALRGAWEARRQRTRTAMETGRQQSTGRAGHDRAGATITRRVAAAEQAVRGAGERFNAALGRLDGAARRFNDAGARLERGGGALAASIAVADPWDWLKWRFYGHGRERGEERGGFWGRGGGMER